MLPTPWKELRKLPATVTWTTRLRKDAALHELPPPRTGRRGRPRVKGARLPALPAPRRGSQLHAGHRDPLPENRCRAGRRVHPPAAAPSSVCRVEVVLVRDRSRTGYDIALVTTDLDASPAAIIERYAARWSIEVAFEDARQVFGAGQARNRTARAVRATIPFTLACQTLAILW